MDHLPVLVICSTPSTASLVAPLEAAHYSVEVAASIHAWPDAAEPAKPLCVVIEVDADDPQAAFDSALWDRLHRRDAAVVIVYGGDDVRFAVRAIREGAVDVLPKPVDGEALVTAVTQALAKAATSHDDAQRGARARALFARCSPRERAIIALAARGLRNKLIAADLACKESTVKVHRSRAMRKLGLRSLAELLRLVESAGGAGALEACATSQAKTSVACVRLRPGTALPAHDQRA